MRELIPDVWSSFDGRYGDSPCGIEERFACGLAGLYDALGLGDPFQEPVLGLDKSGSGSSWAGAARRL